LSDTRGDLGGALFGGGDGYGVQRTSLHLPSGAKKNLSYATVQNGAKSLVYMQIWSA